MIYKLLPTRVFRAYLGGENLDAWQGKQKPEVSRFPEDWLASVTLAFNPGRNVEAEGLSKTEDGVYLKDLIERDPVRMLGDHKEMSLLFKLLDAKERLVIQAHPTVEFAGEYFHSPYGKTECWYLLNDGGYVYIVFKEGITKEYWRQLFEKQDVAAMLDCLHRFEVKKGDFIFVDGGVPHAIGAGCFLAELQEPTDLMVIPERITPSGVVLTEQKLHGGLGFERMMDCFVYEGNSREETIRKYFRKPKKVDAVRTVLVDDTITDKFRLIRLDVTGQYRMKPDSYGIALAIEGCGEINGASIKKGERCFLPDAEKEWCVNGTVELLICTPA